jgi:heme a synthase
VPGGLKRAVSALILLVFVTILSGGFVAGLEASHAYNTFPLMDGHWVPQVIFVLDPVWRNFFKNIATVQFDHRLLATLALITIALLWLLSLRYRLPTQVRTGLHLVIATALLQVTLGISTLLLHVPVSLVTTHQVGALLLLTVVLFVNQRMVRAGKVQD